MIEQTLYSLLSSSTAITAITPRIFPLVLPTDVILPAIDYRIVASTAKATFDTSGTLRFRVEVNSWATQYADAWTLRDAVISTLNRWSDGSTSIQFLMSQDFFDHELLQCRCATEFYVYTTGF